MSDGPPFSGQQTSTLGGSGWTVVGRDTLSAVIIFTGEANKYLRADGRWAALSGGGEGVTDGDKGDIVVTGGGEDWAIDSAVLSAFGRTLINDADAAEARTTLGAAAAGGAPSAHATSHRSSGGDPIKIDDLAEGDDNTDLDASTSKHGLMRKYPGGTTNYLRADGNFAAPTASGTTGIARTFLFMGG